jgi:hypothetical protein
MIMNHLEKRASSIVIVCLLAGLVLTSGCITTAVVLTVAAISADGEDGASVATVQVDKSPSDVYAAAMRIVDRRPDVVITAQDPAGFELSVQRGDQVATMKAADIGGGRTELAVLAQSEGEDTVPEDLAMDIATAICDELGVRYTVVE